MTELLESDTLRQMARAITTGDSQCARTVPVMQWRIDEISQRPVCYWTLEPKSASAD